MLTKEENDLLTRVEGDAPMGRLMRQHWAPVCLVEEVVEPDGGVHATLGKHPGTEWAASAEDMSVRPHPFGRDPIYAVWGDLVVLGTNDRYEFRAHATDGELALREAVRRGATSITIVGALGGPRIDHLLANVALLAHPSLRGVDAAIEDSAHRIWLVRGSSSWRGAVGDCVTLIAVGGDAHGVTTQGLRYVLNDGALPHGSSLGVSNEMTNTHAALSVAGGSVLVIHERQSG